MLWLSNPLKSNSDCGVSSYSHIYYSLDSCHAYVFAGTTMDYSEFTAYVNEDQNCAELTPIGTVHRENPAVNKHSCTPGVDGDLAMCISSLDFCQFIPDHEQALRFEFMVDPKGITKNYLSSLKFYEQGRLAFFKGIPHGAHFRVGVKGGHAGEWTGGRGFSMPAPTRD